MQTIHLEENVEGMMTMTMRLTFAGASADRRFTEIFWKPLNLMARGNVLEGRTPVQEELRAQASASPCLRSETWGTHGGGGVEQDALAEMLEEMSLSTLLYYVLAGDAREMDES
jgi:hypothetical protein